MELRSIDVPRRVDHRTGVINKLHRQRVLLATRSTCRGLAKFYFKFRVCGKGPKKNTLIWVPEFPHITMYTMGGRNIPCQKPARFILQSFLHSRPQWAMFACNMHFSLFVLQFLVF